MRKRKETPWFKECSNPKSNPNCYKVQYYSDKDKLKEAIRKNTVCPHCSVWKRVYSAQARLNNSKAQIGKKLSLETRNKMSESRKGEKSSSYGKPKSEECKRKISESLLGRPLTEETKSKISKALKGHDHSTLEQRKQAKERMLKFNPTKRPEIKLKLRLALHKQIKHLNGNISPFYSKIACEVFGEIEKELGWNGKYATKNGEYYVFGYWVDYYEPNLNIVIEYHEKRHFKDFENGILSDRDIKRQKEIEEFLGCKFYWIKEGQNWKDVIKF